MVGNFHNHKIYGTIESKVPSQLCQLGPYSFCVSSSTQNFGWAATFKIQFVPSQPSIDFFWKSCHWVLWAGGKSEGEWSLVFTTESVGANMSAGHLLYSFQISSNSGHESFVALLKMRSTLMMLAALLQQSILCTAMQCSLIKLVIVLKITYCRCGVSFQVNVFRL